MDTQSAKTKTYWRKLLTGMILLNRHNYFNVFKHIIDHSNIYLNESTDQNSTTDALTH